MAQVGAEFARAVGVDEIVASAADGIDRAALPSRRAHPVECRPHVDVDDDDPERRAIRLVHGGADTQRWNIGLFNGALVLIEIERGNPDFAGGKCHRLREEWTLRLLLEFRIGHETNRAVRTGSVDADEFAATVLDADDSKFRVGGLGFQLCKQAFRQPVAPNLFG